MRMRHLSADTDELPGFELERHLQAYSTAADAVREVLLTVDIVPAEEERLPRAVLEDCPAALAPGCHSSRRKSSERR